MGLKLTAIDGASHDRYVKPSETRNLPRREKLTGGRNSFLKLLDKIGPDIVSYRFHH